MKKLYLGFILLGFLALVPQNIKADVIIYYTPQETHEMSRVQVNSLQCFYNIKSNISMEYKGQNLALKEIPYRGGSSSFKYKPPVNPSYKYLTDANINGQDTCDLFPNGGFNPDKETGLMVPDKTCYDHTISNRQENAKYDVNSFVSDCREYVEVYGNYDYRFRSAYGYDVTDVPPGSYLKFIPETKEVQVISNKDESYKKDIPSKVSALNEESKRLKTNIPTNTNNDNFPGGRYEREENMKRLANAKSLYCLYNKKSKLSQKYSGKDIKLESCDKYKQYSYKDHIYYPICGGYSDSYYGTRDVYDYFIYGDTVEGFSFRYHLLTEGISLQKNKVPNEIIIGNGKIGSLHGNCNEYIAIDFLDIKSKKHITYFADVTDVPPNSYLQYVPENKTFKVTSPADKNYADIAKKYKEKQKENAKEEQLAKEYIKKHKNKLKERYDLQITFED